MAIRSLLKVILLPLLLLTFGQFTGLVAYAQTENVPRITAQELKAKLDSGENVIILDTRLGAEWESSKIKIKNAIRMSIVQIEDRYKELPGDREIVTYCT